MLDSGSLFIQNASGIQIGNNNMLSIRGNDPSVKTLCNGSVCLTIKEAIQKYGNLNFYCFNGKVIAGQ